MTPNLKHGCADGGSGFGHLKRGGHWRKLFTIVIVISTMYKENKREKIAGFINTVQLNKYVIVSQNG